MRFVIVGAGAVGGVVGGFLARSGAEVAFVARGEHLARIQADGLRVGTRDGGFVASSAVAVGSPAELDPPLGAGDVVLLAVKTQDTRSALDDLVAGGADRSTPIACLQNGVDNEPMVAEQFDRVYGVTVMAPTAYLEPGKVEAKSGPIPAILDIGRYPNGVDEVAEEIAAAFVTAGMVSEARPDIMRWKWSKLLLNLGNAVQVVCGASNPASAGLAIAAIVEGREVLEAAGIDVASAEEERERRGDILQTEPGTGVGGSTWQSVQRGSGSIETDHLTGTIVRLGREQGVPTPVNSMLLELAHEVASAGNGPGAMDPDELLARARS